MSVLCTNVLVCARIYVFARVRHTSGENSYVHGHIHMCMFVSASANKCIFKCDLMFYTFVVVLDGLF